MDKLKLNETPVRTARNFNMNNIKLQDVEISQNVGEFSGVQIICDTSKISVENTKTKCNLTYGLSENLEKQVVEKSNQNIKIVIDSKVNKELEIYFKFDGNNMNLIENIDITVNEGAKGTITLKYNSDKEEKYFHNGIVKVFAKKNSNLNIIIANLINEKSHNFMSIENILEENATVSYNMIEFGGKNSVINYYSNLLGNNSENNINGMYLGKDNQLFDLNYIGELRGEKSNINIEVQGALKDNARKHFKGTIDFKKGCKKAKGNENESCMLLSNTAKSLALPMLLCSEEDVEGNHSTSSGKASEKELFYIMSRGFDLKSALKLLVRAKLNKILENIPNEKVRNEISFEIDNRLD